MKRSKYPYIRAWGTFIRSFKQYIDMQEEKAAEENAPEKAIYKAAGNEGRWVTVDEIKNPELRAFLEEQVARMEKRG